MLQSFAILFVSNTFFPDEKQYSVCKFLINQLHSLQYVVEKISFVQEEDNVVTNEIQFLSKEYDFVIVVDAGLKNSVIPKALSTVCSKESKIPQFTNNFSNHDHKDLHDKPCTSPTRYWKLSNSNKPADVLVYLERIFVMQEDNVECFFLQFLRDHLQQYQTIEPFRKKFQVNLNEVSLENNLDIFNKFPVDKKTKEIIIIHLEKVDFEAFVEDEMALKKLFSDKVTEIYDRDLSMQRILNSKEDHICEAIKTIEKCLETYGLDNVFLTFNGGKDCTVLLHLLDLIRKSQHPDNQKPLFCLYVRDNNTFPEQDEFVAQCQVYYNLDILSLSLGMKEALGELLSRKPNMKACFLGTRRTDPYSANLKTFQMTDSSWPSIMRVNPVLDWHYSDIWDYLLLHKVPYCKLYDQGYTSLGSASCTVKNPSLLHYSIKRGKEMYLPAYKLLREAEERSGRDNTKK